MAGPVRWGVLSTARINDAFLAGAAASPDAEVRAVASRDGERARAYATERSIATAHASYEALLEDPTLEAVYISLPNALHLPWAQRALRAGKHVLCEKPLGADASAVAAAFDLAEAQDRRLAEAFMYRHHPQTRTLHRMVGEGAIGRLRSVRAHFTFPLLDPRDVRLDPALDGGALMDLGCYCVSAARLLAGEPETFAGIAVPGGVGDGVDVAFVGALGFADGVTASVHASFREAASSGLEVTGETGTLTVADPWQTRAPAIVRDGTETTAIAPADAYRLEIEDFSRAVRGEALPRLGRADGVGQARALERLYAAAAVTAAAAAG